MELSNKKMVTNEKINKELQSHKDDMLDHRNLIRMLLRDVGENRIGIFNINAHKRRNKT